METITSSELPPRRLTSPQRKRRLDEESRLPDEAIKRAETALRRGLWKKHLDNVSGLMSCCLRQRHPDFGVLLIDYTDLFLSSASCTSFAP